MLRAIALKLSIDLFIENSLFAAEIIMLRAIALKPSITLVEFLNLKSRDHNATSYSTETQRQGQQSQEHCQAEIIMLRAIALKH